MKNLYYKIIFGYDAEDYIEITGEELEKASYAHLKKKDGSYSGGTVSGDKIIAIQPDYHKAMGWNRGYKLGSEDYAEISNKNIDTKHKNYLSTTKDKIYHLIETKQENLIGKNLEIEGFKPKDALHGDSGMKSIGDILK